MPLSVTDIFNRLSAWPHRGVGTEEEMEAREALITELTGEFDVEIKEEGFNAPSSYIPFFWLNGLFAGVALMGASFIPSITLLLGALALVNVMLFFDWRYSPLIWWGANRTTANLVASRGQGARLFIVMAHIDSAPASFAYRPAQVRYFRASVYMLTACFSLAVLIPLLFLTGVHVGGSVLMAVAGIILLQLILMSADYWWYGYTPGANDNLTGVAAATSAASHLWRHMPKDAEVRLVITSAEEAGMLGAQHYLKVHHDALKARDTCIINIDTVGCKHLNFVVKSGGYSKMRYDNILTRAADTLIAAHPDFKDIRPFHHEIGDFDSIWFARADIPVVTLSSSDEEGLMPHIHTPHDDAEHVTVKNVETAARFAEAIVRACAMPPQTASS